MKYLKVWTNFRDVIRYLTLEEKGRLFDAMLQYADTGEEPETFKGNEKVIWPVAKRDIDMAGEWRETCRANGLKGGRPKTQQNPTKPKKTEENPNEQKETLKEKKGNEIKGNETKSSFMDDAEATEIQHEHDRVLDAAEDAGFKMSNDVRYALTDLYAKHGLEKMLEAFKACVKHGAPNLAYLEAVLKGKPKQTKPVVVAQDYEQRDYSGVQDEILDRQRKEFESRINGKKVLAQQYEQRDYSGVQAELMAQQDREMEEFLRTGGVA